MSLVEVENLTHEFPDGTVAVRNLDLQIREGEFIVLAGRNGSGKTVLMRHLNGLLSPTSGRVLLEGRDIRGDLLATRQQIGLVFQDADSQIVGQTVEEDIAFGPENLNLSREEIDRRVQAALLNVGLQDLADHRPHLLSDGEKRRLAIAGVLAMRPRLIVLDEPFSGLDFPGVRQILEQILKLHTEGHTIVVITHDVQKVLKHADRLLIMERGALVLDGSPVEILPGVEQYGIRGGSKVMPLEAMTWLN